jgi:hypothetical protein
MAATLSASANPLLQPLSLFLVGLSLSIGWGIRGQFGHESGAWIPGALAAIAVCLLSQRDDWQRRVGYWFNLAWCAMSCAFVALMIVHQRRRLEIVPPSWIGKGELIYVLLLWIMVIGNFERLLPNFSEGRLITEWVIIINASLATFLALVLPAKGVAIVTHEPIDYLPFIRRVVIAGLGAAALLMTLYAGIVSKVFGPGQDRISGAQYRFGENATWRIKPILKNKDHR